MPNFELRDRLNWRQACTLLGCSKTTLYRLEREGKIDSFGAGKRNRWYSQNNISDYLRANNKLSEEE